MIQRKVCGELGIQADRVNFDKGTTNMKVDYSKHQDGKGRGTYGMKKIKKSSLIKLLDMEALESPPPRKSLSQSKKMLPLHVPTTAATAQKHKPLLRKSPNYMKPTSSSEAKKELLPVSLQNTQFGSDGKNLPQKSLSKSKSSSAPYKKTAKIMSRSSSVNLVRTLTKTLSFKQSRICPRKPTAIVLRADISAPYRATCSSTLKDSKFPEHLMLNTGGSESEGALIMKVCPYIYCSLNGNHHPPEKRRFFKTRKSIKLEGSEKLKVPCETRNDFDIEPIVFDGKPACDEADRGNPSSITLIREIGIDFSFQVNDKEREKAYKMGRSDAVKNLEDQEGIKFAMEGNGNIAEEEGVYLVNPYVPCDLTKSEINPKVEFKNYFDGSEIEAETKESFHQKLNAEDSDKNHPPNWFYEGICTGTYTHEVSYDEELMENIELDDSNSQGKEEKNTSFDAQPRDTKFVQESSSESIQADYPSNGTDHEYDLQYLKEEEFQFLTNIEDNVREIEKHVDNGASCTSMVLEEDTVHNREAHKISETHMIEESREDSNTNLENNAKEISQMNQILSSDLPGESSIIAQDHKLLEEDLVTATKFQTICCKGGEGQNTSNNWQSLAKNKRIIQDDEEMRMIKPRKPNFLPLVPDPKPEKVELRHQMIDDRKNAEEWMLDFSLRQAVTKLAPARKKKVPLLVEAFETVMSTS
ncbi:unnamed protein product [Vicia faba]|uniref:Calmodulin-binding domain-containing protein n=1 Tax=Vicia faba TaxID=3906 RepID=A0AAV0YFY5_VICFA|nr:unnamed protein product [Vicia faba]